MISLTPLLAAFLLLLIRVDSAEPGPYERESRVKKVLFHLSLLAFVWAQVALADPCPKDSSQLPNAPVPQSNLNALATASNAAASLPDSPDVTQQKIKNPKKLPWYRITVKATGQTAIQKPQVVTLTLDPTNPNQQADFTAALNMYNLIVLNQTGSPQTFDQMKALLKTTEGKQICNPQTKSCVDNPNYLSFNAKAELLSMLGNQLDNLYNVKALGKITPLPTVFQALKTDTQNAGVCRDIHAFLAVACDSMGLKDAGTTGLEWNNGIATGGHVIAECKDPTTGNFIFINYDHIYRANTPYLSEAAQQASLASNAFSMLTNVNSGPVNDPRNHPTQDPRAGAILNEVDQAADLSQPRLSISLGTLENSVSVHAKIAGGNQNNIGVFGLAVENRQELPVQVGVAGVSAKVGGTEQLSNHLALQSNTTIKGGVIDVHDQYAGQGRNETAVFVALDSETDLVWNTSKNQGKVGVKAKFDDDLYLNARVLDPAFDIISIVAVDNPSKKVQLHASSDYYVGTRTNYDITPGVTHTDDTVGVKVTQELAGGKVNVSNDFTYHTFAQSGAQGVQDRATASITTRKFGTCTAGADVGYVHNGSNDPFYDYPMTGDVTADCEKVYGRVTIDAGGKYGFNKHNPFTLMQDGNPPGWTLTQPKWQGGVTITW